MGIYLLCGLAALSFIFFLVILFTGLSNFSFLSKKEKESDDILNMLNSYYKK